MTPTEKVLRALRTRDCDPRQIGPGLWLAICPSCRDAGRFELLEVRTEPDGSASLDGCSCDSTRSAGR
jgi:hypothetical protein